MSTATPERKRRTRAILIVALIVLAGAAFVATTLRRPPLEGYPPTPEVENAAGDTLVGPIQYTVNASAPETWVFFDFARGRTVPRGDPQGWDLAFQRFHIIANGGPGFNGRGGIRDLGEIAFDSVMEVPQDGYLATEPKSDSTNPAIARWYKYGWSSHLLQPKPNVYAVRTADGRYAKLQVISYYCTGAIPGCLTFRYVYQGAGGPRFVAVIPGVQERVQGDLNGDSGHCFGGRCASESTPVDAPAAATAPPSTDPGRSFAWVVTRTPNESRAGRNLDIRGFISAGCRVYPSSGRQTRQ